MNGAIPVVIILGMGVLFFAYYSLQTNQISSLQSQVSNLNTQVQNLQGENNALQSSVNNAQNQPNPLQPIVNLQESTIEANSVPVNTKCATVVTSFSAQYAGYLLVTGTTSTSSSYLILVEFFHPYIDGQNLTNVVYELASGSNTVIIPVTDGFVNLLFTNHPFGNNCGSQTASGTFSVQYYY